MSQHSITALQRYCKYWFPRYRNAPGSPSPQLHDSVVSAEDLRRPVLHRSEGTPIATGTQPGKSTEWDVRDRAKTNNIAVKGAKGEVGEAVASCRKKQFGGEPCTCSLPPPNWQQNLRTTTAPAGTMAARIPRGTDGVSRRHFTPPPSHPLSLVLPWASKQW